jgi:hypothetical protein
MMVILPQSLIDTINSATNDQRHRDIILRKYYNAESRAEASKELAKCYVSLKSWNLGEGREEMTMLRLRIETHIEYLNRECVRIEEEIDTWIPPMHKGLRKEIDQIEIGYYNNKFA